MQIGQRGAIENCSGTKENLLIDDMVLKDSGYNKRYLSCCWIDVSTRFVESLVGLENVGNSQIPY